MPAQLEMLAPAPAPELPEGLTYRPDFLDGTEEKALASLLAGEKLAPFDFHGFKGNRRTISYGWHYAFDGSGLKRTEPIPDWLLPVRERAAALAGLEPEALGHALLIEYAPGAGIGWHRDRPVFGDVIGISLLAPARLRFRRKHGDKWQRANLVAEPRSAYLLRGPARSEWEHSIPPMDALRYSITFRSLSSPARGGGPRIARWRGP
jgi:alkylated DNA repair protein (DNA oxidative demethylase)